MLYTQKTLSMLEFDKITAMLADCALTEGAREAALCLAPVSDEKKVMRRQQMTADARRLAETKGYPAFGGVRNISDAIGRAQRGACLQPKDLLEIAALLRVSRGLVDYIRADKPFETILDELFEAIYPNKHLEDRITRAIVSEEMVADEASTELAEIRRKIRTANNRIKETLQKFINGGYAGLLQENIVTMRNDRYVVPVKIEHKNEVKGLVHDTSASGATVFIEPVSVVEANNELKILKNREEREIEKILYSLSALCAENAESLTNNYSLINQIAFAFSCVSLAQRMHASEVRHSKEKKFSLKKAIHPLLESETAVPVDIYIGGEFDTLVITGPNTGGKTVTLKTVGLFALMYQSGLQLPASPNSSMCVFEEILADIGDEQSIEQSLSTFSAHMVNIVEILRQIGPRTLVLLDELGAGTDPIEGAALAVSILEEIRKKGALAAATTHYAELKAYAIETDGVTNASCEFDVETLRPTYKLIIGTPGKSNAFAISKRLGLPSEIVEHADSLISGESKRFERVIEKLEADRIAMERAREESERMRAEYAQFKAASEAEIEKARLEAEKEKERARAQANRMVQSARASSDYVLNELAALKKKKAEEISKEELEKARQSIRHEIRRSSGDVDPVEDLTDKNYKLPRPLKKGDAVLIMSIGQTGTVLSPADKNGMVRVQAGRIATRTEENNLKLLETPDANTRKNKEKTAYRNTVVKEFSPELDIRGMYGDDACFLLDKYLDDAALAGIHTVRIIHGKGTGALKTAVWQYLRGDRRIESYRLGVFGEGDGGVTVLEIK